MIFSRVEVEAAIKGKMVMGKYKKLKASNMAQSVICKIQHIAGN